MTAYVIVGNSVGCIGAVEAIRQVDDKSGIQVISEEAYPAYSRPQIANYLAGEVDVEQTLYRRRSFYRDYGVELLLGRSVVGVDPDQRLVRLDDGRAFSWDRLLLATGGSPIVPPVQNLPENGYLTFTTMADAQRIKERLPDLESAVVVGGGLIGLSVTEALVKLGVETTIVELAPQILGRALDTVVAAQVQTLMENKGVRILTHCSVDAVRDLDPSGQRGVAVLSNGVTLDYDALIMAIGVRPRTELAVDAGIEVNRGIVVDAYMRTSVDGIYACGDVAEAYDFLADATRLTPVWPNAYAGGRVAGLNMAGQEATYEGGTGMNALHSFGYPILSAGTVAPPSDDGYQVLTAQTAHDHGYKKLILRDGRIAGFLFAGDIDRVGVVYGLMKQGVEVSSYAEKLIGDDTGLIALPPASRFDLLRAKGVARRMLEN